MKLLLTLRMSSDAAPATGRRAGRTSATDFAPADRPLGALTAVLLLAGTLACAGVTADLEHSAAVATQALEIVARQRATFTAPPVVMPTRKVPDGPLLGNGDVGVAIGGVIERQKYFGLGEPGGGNVNIRPIAVTNAPERHRFYLAKNDFWKTKAVYPNAHPCPIGWIDVNIPALVDGGYHAEQVLKTAEVVHTLTTRIRVEDPPPFTRAGAQIQLRSWVAATENLLVIELSVKGDPADTNPFQPTDLVGVDVSLWPMAGNESETATGNLPDGYWAVRRFQSNTNTIALEAKPSKWSSEAAVALRLFNHRRPGLPWSRGDGWSADRFVLSPAHPILLAAAIVTSEESPTPLDEARRRVSALTPGHLEALRQAHREWWRDFWSRSFVDIGDPLLERFYYGSLYLLASCSRNRQFPPSLFGNWITQDGPAWQADYHLNYNHQAPWWGVYSSNHPELADPYDTPILDYLPIARDNARRYLQVRGVYYDVGIGPKSLESTFMPDGHGMPGEGNRMFLGQKSNGAFAAVNMFMRFYHTYDLDYARRVYPFLIEVADFWEDYLRLENGRYVITGDALGEVGDGGSDKNNCLSLGLVRMLFQGMLDLSAELGTDAGRRAQWQDILSRLSEFPTVMVDGVRRIRGAEAGPASNRIGPERNNSRVELSGMVWPTGVVGLGSDPALLRVLQDDARGWPEREWINHFNGFSQTFPGAVRIGHDPQDILARLRQQLTVGSFPNLMVFTGGGGIENCSTVPATINEMLLQTHAGVMRVFPVWPRDKPARFGRLRTHGAFLVSAELRDGAITSLRIESEQGRECVLQNPWPGRELVLHRNGEGAEELAGERVQFRTQRGECIDVSPRPAASPGAFLRATDPATGWLTSLRRTGDTSRVEFLRAGASLGAVTLRLRTPGGPWREVRRSTQEVDVHSGLVAQEDALLWEIRVRNTTAEALELGDVALPLPMNTDYVWDHDETFERRVFRHAFVAGHGSFLYWLPVKGSGPILVLMPEGDTALEFFTAEGMDYAYGRERFTVFVHSRASADGEPRGTWRQPRTSRVLPPGQEFACRFAFRWADSYEGVRALLRKHGGVDVHVLPGMVVPRDLEARFALLTQHDIAGIEAEFPEATPIAAVPLRLAGARGYRVTFRRLGENRLTVRYGNGRTLPLEFFVTEPLETLIRKRAAFIVKHQQHRDPGKWYDGLYSLWDRRQPEGGNLLGPDHLAGQHPYAVSGSDDPSNGKCLLVAEKNVAYPDAEEIASLEYFIKHFVWGKHQRTDAETPFPYGIYGSDSWQQNRFTDRDPLGEGISRPGGPSACRLWRTFDYTTYFALYFNLYRIAKQRPDLVKELSAAQYLERAYGTARAYFEVPASIRMEGGWSFTGWVYWQYTVGNIHEKYLLPLIAALEAEGRQTQADHLRAEWEKKVKYFLYDHPWPFASEMPIDSTAYESTYAAGRYALEQGLTPDTHLWHDRNLDRWFSHPVIDPRRHADFLQRQHLANLACRGVLAASYWSLGSDFRGCGSASYTLSYMSQMGGWAVLDYALRFDPDPAAHLRLGYASMLSSWALVNSGDAASDYGFWMPGPLHDGAMSWGFQPRQVGTEWNPATTDLARGAWPVCGEADHGLVAGIEAASTILLDDPLFGRVALGGSLVTTNALIGVIPRDGVRQRFHAVLGKRRLHLALDRDGFAAEQPIRVAATLDRFAFALESRSPSPHDTAVFIEGLPPGPYTATVGACVRAFQATESRVARLELPVQPGHPNPVRIEPAVQP